MTTAYGSKDDAANRVFQNSVLLDAAAPATLKMFTVPTGWEGFIDINKSLAVVTTTVIGTGDATVTINKNTTAVGAATCAVASSAVGDTFVFTPVAGYEQGVALAAADYVTFTIAGTTGKVLVSLMVELSSLAR